MILTLCWANCLNSLFLRVGVKITGRPALSSLQLYRAGFNARTENIEVRVRARDIKKKP